MRNELISSLLPSDLDLLRPNLAHCEMSPRQILHDVGSPITSVFFPEHGLVSILAFMGEQSVETALVGREGMVGAAAILRQSHSPYRSLVQVPGPALRIGATELRTAMAASQTLTASLLHYVHRCFVQAGHTVFSTGRCTLDQRLSRWLLMVHDRLGQDDIDLTHECIATTLGVRRPGITVALHVLEGEHAIRSKRGRITILDRECLKRFAGPAYDDSHSSPPKTLPLATAA